MHLNILNISNNSYKEWLTFEGEYINEAFEMRSDISLLKWGLYRDDINQSKKYSNSLDDSILCFYGHSNVDAVIVGINDIFTMNVGADKSLLSWLKENKKKFKLLIRVNDPWRFSEKIKIVVNELSPAHIFLPSIHSKKIISEKFEHTYTRFHILPYCIGRRFFNMGIDREYDLAMIGRCQIDNKNISPYNFLFGYKVFSESSLSKIRNNTNQKHYFSRIMNTVINLNKSKAAFNSPVIVKGSKDIYHTPFRYLEAAACGAVSLSTFSFYELNELYFPKNTYIDCNNSLKTMKLRLNEIKKCPEEFTETRLLAFKYVMLNHQASNRVEFMVDLIKGVNNIIAMDYYKFRG